MTTAAEQAKAAKKEANKALAATLRDLVDSGKADEAVAMVQGKGASWQQLVTDHAERLKAREAKKAAKAATPAKAEKAAPAAPAVPAGNPIAIGASGQIADLLAAIDSAMAAIAILQEAPAAPAEAPAVPAVSTPSAFLLRDPEAPLKGFAFLVGGKVGKLVKAGDSVAITAAKKEALQCAKWCDNAAKAESDKAERDRLTKKAAIFRKAAATLKNA